MKYLENCRFEPGFESKHIPILDSCLDGLERSAIEYFFLLMCILDAFGWHTDVIQIQGRLKPKFYCVHFPCCAFSFCVWRLIYSGGAFGICVFGTLNPSWAFPVQIHLGYLLTNFGSQNSNLGRTFLSQIGIKMLNFEMKKISLLVPIQRAHEKFVNAVWSFCLRILGQKRQKALTNFSLTLWHQKNPNRLFIGPVL